MKKPQEKSLKIKLSDRFSIYGNYAERLDAPLFIVVHGLLGNMDEEFYRASVLWFAEHGFSTFRFNLYGSKKDARQLMNCTLKIHASDLDAVIRYFRNKGIKKIFVAGHSFGGLTILSSQKQDFDAAVLWDPSYKISFTKKNNELSNGKYIKNIKGYLMRWGINVIIGKAMADEIDLLSWDLLAKNFKVPTKIVLAGNGALKNAKNYYKNLISAKSLTIISGATHYFDNLPKMQENVFRISKEWFIKQIVKKQ